MNSTKSRHIQFLIALVIIVTMPLFMKSGSLASEVLIYGLAAMGCNLLLGYTGLLSFGQGVFFGLGSYTLGILLTRLPIPMPVVLVLAVLVGALGAAIVGWVAIRQRGTYFVMLTLAFAQMFYFVAYSVPSLTGGDNGLMDIPRKSIGIGGQTLIPLDSPWQYYGFVAVIFLVVYWLLRRACDSIFGRTLLAVRDNEERAAAVGYNLRLLKLQAFVISGAVTGLAGALHALMTGIAPLSNAEYHTSEMILVMTVIGGTGNLLASLLGAAFYVLLGDWLSTLWPRWLLILGVVLMVVSLGMQGGLWGLWQRLWELARGKKSDNEEDDGNAAANPGAAKGGHA